VSQATTLAEFADITLREHTAREVTLFDDEVALLRREFAGRLDVAPTPSAGVYTLQSHQYVGFAVLPGGRVIEIRPKVQVGVLFAMLAKVHGLVDFGPEPSGYRSVADLFEFVVDLFAGMVEDLVARGILRGFEPREDDLLAPRGKVLVTETIRRRPVVRDRHWCAFTEFTTDVAENRILRLTCDGLLPFHYPRVPDLSARLRRLLRTLADVTHDPDAVGAFDRLVFHRLNEHYRPALALARLLLSCLSPGGSRGPHRFLAFLVNMNTLFERYVTAVLKEAAAGRSDLRVVDQDPQTLDLDRQVNVRPDVVLYRNEVPALALDAKYKRAEPGTDVYQALAYCHALKLPCTVLVYPAGAGIAALRHRIKPPGSIEVVRLTLDLSGTVVDLERQTREFVASVWRETV